MRISCGSVNACLCTGVESASLSFCFCAVPQVTGLQRRRAEENGRALTLYLNIDRGVIVASKAHLRDLKWNERVVAVCNAGVLEAKHAGYVN